MWCDQQPNKTVIDVVYYWISTYNVVIIDPIESQQMTTARHQGCNITNLNQSKNNFFRLANDFSSDSMELLIFDYMEKLKIG